MSDIKNRHTHVQNTQNDIVDRPILPKWSQKNEEKYDNIFENAKKESLADVVGVLTLCPMAALFPVIH